jgi:hypothetical protein
VAASLTGPARPLSSQHLNKELKALKTSMDKKTTQADTLRRELEGALTKVGEVAKAADATKQRYAAPPRTHTRSPPGGPDGCACPTLGFGFGAPAPLSTCYRLSTCCMLLSTCYPGC